MEKTYTLQFNGYEATIIRPENPNGKWIWKTEFLDAFEQAEVALLKEGYTRIYYKISDKYGSYDAVRLMRKFHRFIVKEFNLEEKCILFGFSRGGLYAFNFALFYPEYVKKVYLDAPVLDLKTWPNREKQSHRPLVEQMYKEYGLNDDTILTFQGNPIDKLQEFFSLNIPLLLIAGDADQVVDFGQNSGKLIEYCKIKEINLISIVKHRCLHHPHSLEDVTPILDFVKSEP